MAEIIEEMKTQIDSKDRFSSFDINSAERTQTLTAIDLGELKGLEQIDDLEHLLTIYNEIEEIG